MGDALSGLDALAGFDKHLPKTAVDTEKIVRVLPPARWKTPVIVPR